jgi:hypothetical protein
MRKCDEMMLPDSCLNKAAENELLFVLRDKDPCMAGTIRYWARMRMELGLNTSGDSKIKEAVTLAAEVERVQEERGRPDTTNYFAVGVQGETIRVLRTGTLTALTKAEALNLAAHLVALADDKDEFDKLLEAVQSS